jgi:hypothetical protein
MHKKFWSKILKRPLGRTKHRWEDNIRVTLRERGWKVVDWIHLARIGTCGGLLLTQ